MKKKIMIKSIIIFVIGFIIYESYTIIEMFNKTSNIEEVNTQKVLTNDKSIAIMVQDAETEDWHEATNRDTWPSPTTHGYVGAECTDSDGKEIDYTNILHFDLSTYHATIDTKNSIYCTLYFAKGMPALQKLQETGGEVFAGGGQHTTAVDGMYRYKGTTSVVNNNYICFGTTDKTECLNKPDTYMYRIIGITSEDRTENNGQDTMWKKGQLKIIKAIRLTDGRGWHDDRSGDVWWDSTTMKNYLNGLDDENQFLYILQNMPNGTYWESIITSQSWYNSDLIDTPGIEEPRTRHSLSNKIGLMYATDFNNASTGTSSWLFIKNGWNTNKAEVEWTMSRNGNISGWYRAWSISSSGELAWGSQWLTNYIRPAFYLQPELNLTGTGKSDNPFRITTKNNAN